MLDLLGVLAPDGTSAGGAWERPDAFPRHDESYARRGSVATDHLGAVWLARPGEEGYGRSGDRHLFVVGDVFYRTDARGRAPGGRVSVPELLDGLREPAALLRGVKGSFTLVLVDEEARTCRIYGSRAAMSPFYYAAVAGSLYFSTSLAALAGSLPARPAVDPAGVAELALFNYPIGSRTFLRGIRMLVPGDAVAFEDGSLRQEPWWDPASLYAQETLPVAAALDEGAALFHRVVNDAAAGEERLRVSFTSGFDSRAILAVLDRPPADLMTYAFGIPGSVNVSIPQRISARLGIPFTPIYLTAEYEAAFDGHAYDAIALSDCLSTVERANYPYAFRKLAAFAPVVLTGLFGSELLRTFQNVGHIVSESFLRIDGAPETDAAVRDLLPGVRYFAPELVADAADDVAADFEAWRARLGDLARERHFYMFLLLEGLRKYFGAEVHMERPWGLNRFPFLDDEFVEFAFRAPFTGVHGRHTDPTIRERFRSQYFYAHVIREHRPELLPFTTDHGYPPGDVLSRVWPLKVGTKFVARRVVEKRSRYREFRTEEWTGALYRRRLFDSPADASLFTGALRGDFEDGSWTERRPEFAKAASLKLWLETL